MGVGGGEAGFLGLATAYLPFGAFTPVDMSRVVVDHQPMTSTKALRYGLATLLAASGLYGFSLLLHPTSDAGATPGVDCVSIQGSVTHLLDKGAVPTIGGWADNATIRQNGLTAAHLIINNPACFDPTAVAAAQTAVGAH